MIRLGLTIAAAIVGAFVVIVLLLEVLYYSNGGPNTYAPCKEAPQYQCANGG